MAVENGKDAVLYRIGDADMTNVGRRQRGSKKRIRFRYALKVVEDGDSGVSSGKMKHRNVFEHEVVLLWSFHSGKAVVQHDSVEIKTDRNPHPSVVDITWTEPSPVTGVFGSAGDGAAEKGGEETGGRTFRIVCCRTKPINSPETFRKYELVVDGKPLISYPNLPGHADDAEGGTFVQSPGLERSDGTPNVYMSILEVLFPDGNYGCKKRTQDELSTSFRAEEDTNTIQCSEEDSAVGDLGSPPSVDLIDFGSADDNDGVVVTEATSTSGDNGVLVSAPQSAPVPVGGDMLGSFDALAVSNAAPPKPEENVAALIPHGNGTQPTAGYDNDLLSAFGADSAPALDPNAMGAVAPHENCPNPAALYGDTLASPVVAPPADTNDPFSVFGTGSLLNTPATVPETAITAVVPHAEGTQKTAGYRMDAVPVLEVLAQDPAPVAASPAPPAAHPTTNDDPFSIFGTLSPPAASETTSTDPFA
eukprot:CAMPEP_0113526242 /NCGR_PEP_ID=MMETSP0015_2-20120614/633_1 /TAXON_ID=2838 /ORGANISM="Odontella" /LENGTH=475 /DNA_ID=CAMNT_0000424547 /DNA_START=140 /DNA_END=1567 /DNA_ORIENTATION=+ /assembly_acc=CAM_ASM_000160